MYQNYLREGLASRFQLTKPVDLQLFSDYNSHISSPPLDPKSLCPIVNYGESITAS